MKILVHRFEYGTNFTISRLSVDNVYQCFALEDVVRPVGAPKVWGATAIPAGTYNVIMSFSPHFNQDMPHLVGVPNFGYVMIHWGNTDVNTDGCLLVGTSWAGGDFIGNSRAAFDMLLPKIVSALKGGTVSITIEDTN